MESISTHRVEKVDRIIRINDYLIGVFELLPSRKSIKKAIQKGQIFVNGMKAPSSLFIKEGMLIEFKKTAEKPSSIYPLELELVFEDEYLAIINKPAGLISSGNQFRTLYNALPANIKPSGEKDALSHPQLVHRLDSATSGLILVAKTSKCLVKLGEMLRNREIEKTYIAIVHGKIKDKGEINTPINGKEALSLFSRIDGQVSSAFDFLSKVILSPKTGRTHQLRIHMKENNTPILGDRLYCDPDILLKGKGLFLSAIGLEFTHPMSGELMKIEMDPPTKFDQYWAWTLKRHEKDQ